MVLFIFINDISFTAADHDTNKISIDNLPINLEYLQLYNLDYVDSIDSIEINLNQLPNGRS